MWEELLKQAQDRMTNELSLNKTQEAHCWQILSDLADAMQEALKATGFKLRGNDYIKIPGLTFRSKRSGTLVLIPEEE